MVLRKESVIERLKKLETIIANLDQKNTADLKQYSQDLDLQWYIERGLEVGSSIIFDIGNHILAGYFKISVEEYEHILKQLQGKKVISEELYENLSGLGGFRNILVHNYLSLDHELVFGHYQKALLIFPRFIAEVYTWLENENV
jgi:uncharacterized protein YutE (UPF0331/DUF86 family)